MVIHLKGVTTQMKALLLFSRLAFYGTDIVNFQSYLESLMPSNSAAPKTEQAEEETGLQRYEERIASLEESMRAQGRLLSAIADKLQVNTD